MPNKSVCKNPSAEVHSLCISPRYKIFIVLLLCGKNILQLKHFVTLMCLFVLTSKWYLNCPFSPGIEEHAGNGEIPSYEGSTVLFVALCCMRCDALSLSCMPICSISLILCDKAALCSVLTFVFGFKCLIVLPL